MKIIMPLSLFLVSLFVPATYSYAIVGFADTVLDFHDSGAGPLAGPYGGTWNGTSGSFPVPVSLDVVVGDDPGFPGANADFLSLPTGSFVTVGFSDETVIDGPGDDVFITEVGGNGERANVFVSSNLVGFTFLGTAIDNVTTGFDLNSISFGAPVQAIRIVGLDAFGDSPGFDVINVRVLPGSVGPPTVPEPSSVVLLASVVSLFVLVRRRWVR